jgi:hypothetical protein
MSGNRLPGIIQNCRPKGRRNGGRPLKRLVDVRELNRSTGGPTACWLDDDDGDGDDDLKLFEGRKSNLF